jgi:2-polyprenyl-3-methyl-5-hydroxy-6-metoxy-1,4-benzoquinol methylase
MKCKICENESSLFLNAPIFEKTFLIDYFKCNHCGFIQTQEPTWLDRAYSDAIAPLDIGLLQRNRTYSDLTEKLLLTFFNNTKSFVDFGAGYGVFVRMMRDKGFEFKWYDTHCENLFAKHFEEKDLNKTVDVITAFEVFEHLPNPVEQLKLLIQNSNVLIFSTDITYEKQSNFLDWWYRAPQSGQHVSFYTYASLSILAKKFNKHFYSNGNDYHFISSEKIDDHLVVHFFQFNKKNILQRIIHKFFKTDVPLQYRDSLLQQDHAYLTKLYSKIS